MSSRKLWCDADVLAYEVAFGAQRTKYRYLNMEWEDSEQCKAWCTEKELNYRKLRTDGEITTHVEVLAEGFARNLLNIKIDAICKACESDNYQLILSGDGNYRDTVAVTKGYKANRAESVKPEHFLFVRRLIIEKGAVVTCGIEADDLMGIEATADPEAVVCTIDKDLNMIEGRHYDWNKKLRYKVPPAEAHRWFLKQLLTGDSTDNIPGLPRYGDKKAANTLDPHRGNVPAMWASVKDGYAKAPFKFQDGTVTADSDTYLTEQGKLLWIQRKPDEQWTPTYYETEYVNK